MSTMQEWLVNVALKKMGPSAVRAVLAAFVGLLVAHANDLAKFGIVYDGATKILSIHLGTLQDWLVAAGLGSLTAILTALQHHTTAAITGAPQTGAKAA